MRIDALSKIAANPLIQKLATRAAEITVAIASGEEPEPDMYINNNSGKSIPYFIERPIPVFRENIDSLKTVKWKTFTSTKTSKLKA